jgi:hypothetical protein
MKRIIPWLLVLGAGTAFACPDAAKSADARVLDKMATATPAMSPAPDARPAAAQLAKKGSTAGKTAAAQTPAKKPAGG